MSMYLMNVSGTGNATSSFFAAIPQPALLSGNFLSSGTLDQNRDFFGTDDPFVVSEAFLKQLARVNAPIPSRITQEFRRHPNAEDLSRTSSKEFMEHDPLLRSDVLIRDVMDAVREERPEDARKMLKEAFQANPHDRHVLHAIGCPSRPGYRFLIREIGPIENSIRAKLERKAESERTSERAKALCALGWITYGTDSALHHLLKRIHEWVDLGMPSGGCFSLKAYPCDREFDVGPDEWVSRREHSAYVWRLNTSSADQGG